MAAESKKDHVGDSVTSKDTEVKTIKKKKGVFSRIWDSVFRSHGNDFEKRLQYITKEEATVLNRITKRSHSWRRTTRHLIIFSVFFEVIAVGYAIMTTRSLHLNWKMRALRVLPMFLLPALSFITYSALRSFTKMRDRKDHNTLEKLRAERLEKINELKEKTNYYITQQLIQRYDPDPAAKAAAATVLASKLGADSGLKVRVGDDPIPNVPTGKSHDVEVARTAGLRNRKQVKNTEHGLMHHQSEGGGGEMVNHNHDRFIEGEDMSEQPNPLVVEHHPQMGLNPRDGGWIARLAALLVGEDPTQSYALICGNCHMHNGLARKEDFPYITYYCPHCNALNRPKQQPGAPVSGSSSPTLTSLATAIVDNAQVAPSMSENKPPSSVVGSTTVDKVTSPVGGSTANKVSSSTSPTAVADTDADAASASGETSKS